MKIKPRHVFALALMGTAGAWAADGAKASLDFFDSSLAPFLLTGIARDADGTVAVNLSFDLIGFGNTPASMGSHVQVSDARLLGLPQAADDSVSTEEDTSIAINLVA